MLGRGKIKQTFTRDFITQACEQAHVNITDLHKHLGISNSHFKCVLREERRVSEKLAGKLHRFFNQKGVWADWWILLDKG